MPLTPAVPPRPLASRWGGAVVAALIAVVMVAAGGPATAITAASAGGTVSAPLPAVDVVVQKLDLGDTRPEEAVEALGGVVGDPLAIVDGFRARIPVAQVDVLRASAGVGNVTVNRPVRVSGQYGEGSGVASAVYSDVVRAPETWRQGYTGRGIGVALIDTGVDTSGDLAGKVLHAVDFTHEQNNADSYGHGTYIAGLIAGQGTASNGAVMGVAPEAHLVSVKIAGADGNTDLVRLLAGLEWVVTHKDAYGIRILNLALGTDSAQSYLHDPLNFAVERVWNSGIVVVVAAGNGGTAPGTISKPGDDPLVITAGATDDRTTPGTADDTLAPFSGVGPTVTDNIPKPDVVAPGKSVVSSRAAGSSIDVANPEARVDDAYFKGSGTSAASAVTSGTAALVLSREWSLNPDQVKHRLVANAQTGEGVTPAAGRGAGIVDAFNATMSSDTRSANQDVVPARGGGSLQASRGSRCLLDGSGACLSDGDADAITGFDPVRYFGSRWAGSRWAGSRWAGSEWAGSQWTGSEWRGSHWVGSQWAGSQWAGSRWAGSQWAGSQWAGSRWAGSQWAGSRWAGSRWAGSQWAGSRWAGSQWSGSQWAGSRWAGSQWSGSQWSGSQWSGSQWSGSQWSGSQWSGSQWSGSQWSGAGWLATWL